MLEEVKKILTNFNVLSTRKVPILSAYITGLMLSMKKHSFQALSKVGDCDPSRFSALLNSEDALDLSLKVFNRTLKRSLKKRLKNKKNIFIAIDATYIKRTGGVENSQFYYSGSGFVHGHKIINVVLVLEEGIIPLASVPVYTREYCISHNMVYETENEKVLNIIESIKYKDWVKKLPLKKLYFLLDSGYDVKKIEKSILKMGANFVISLKARRSVKGMWVSNYFKRHKKNHKGKTIRFIGSGRRRITYRVRQATKVALKGIGAVNIVCSEGKRGYKKTLKYLATNNLKLKAREVAEFYRRRWSIEVWHKEIKQKYGYRDCTCMRFSAVYAHINYTLTAYILANELKQRQRSLEGYILDTSLKNLRAILTKIGKTQKARIYIREAIQRVAA